MSPTDGEFDGPGVRPTFREAVRFWLKLGFISFGGPTGQIAIMHAELVQKRKWVGEPAFLHALNYCMLLPGPEAQQLAIYIGWLLHRTRGGLAAGILFVLPSIFILLGLSAVYVSFGQVPWIGAVFHGLKPAVLAIVAAAVVRIGRTALRTPFRWGLAAAAFIAIYFFRLPFPAVILGAALLGWVTHRLGAGNSYIQRAVGGHRARALDPEAAMIAAGPRPSRRETLRLIITGLSLWWFPVLLAGLTQGWAGTLVREGVFFGKAALVTFGGAYAVLPYVAQQAVGHFGWLTGPQMLDGLAFAETTPGPLVMVLQHVGFMAGWTHPGTLPPWLSAVMAGLLATWMTFAPCFLWVFLGAPHVENLRGQVRLNAALSAVTAAVVGVVLNLAIWFGIQALRPAPGQFDAFAVIVAVVGLVALERFKASVPLVIFASGAAGVVWHLL